MLKKFFLFALLLASHLAASAQCRGFITPNFGATYTEQEALIDEQMEEEQQKKGEFHASVEAGVAASFGHSPWAGSMFYTGINGTYFRRINKKLTLATGFDVYNYAGSTDATTLGVYAMAHYQFNERVDGTLYVAHNFGNIRGNQVTYNPMLMRGGMGYGLYGGGLFNAFGYNSFVPSTTVAGSLGWTTKRGGRIDIGFSFTHADYRNSPYVNPYSPFANRRFDTVGGMPTFY